MCDVFSKENLQKYKIEMGNPKKEMTKTEEGICITSKLGNLINPV